ncbi:MAG: hypothetical protein GX774_15100 [Armatimonadetes bacterium]|nr:hypothetical protein [Armatimonadota bacterium]
MVHTLTSTKAPLEVQVEPLPNDLRLLLKLRDGARATHAVTYSQLTAFSWQRPWSLVPGEVEGITVKAMGPHALLVDAEVSGFHVEDLLSVSRAGLRLRRRWTYRGLEPRSEVVVGTCLPAGEGTREKITLPHVLYNNNPAADPNRLVPHLPREAGYALVVEEHRLPIPGINVEWEVGGEFYALTLLAVPATVTLPGAQPDHAWSLGGVHAGSHLELVSLSGVVALNNEKDVIYGAQNRAFPYPGGGYLTLQRGDVLEKTVVIELHRCEAEGRGFRRLVRVGWEVLRPTARPALGLERAIDLKLNALQSRWREQHGHGGFTWIPDTPAEGNVYNAPPGFLFGWVGQSLRLAWCALAHGLRARDKGWVARGQAVLDCFAAAPQLPEAPGLRYLFCDLQDGEWYAGEWRGRDRISTRMFGEAITNLADCLLLLRRHELPVKQQWRDALDEGARFLASPRRLNEAGIFPIFLTPAGRPADEQIAAGGVACVTALLAAAEVTSDPWLRAQGLELLQRYYAHFARTLERPFSRATLDAACEDKEAGIYFFLAAYRAFVLTGDRVYGEYARLAAEWITTFVYFWDVAFRPGSACAINAFRSTFWPGVSVQNMHLDVFFPAFEVYDLGRRLEDRLLRDVGRGVVQAWTHGIAQRPGHWGFPTRGEQAEQFNHTNYFQGPFTEADWRGSVNRWNPSWIIGLVLQAALRFQEGR